MAESIGDQIKSGALWTYLQGGVGTVIQFGTGIVLARLLNPDQFGVFLAVSAYTAILVQQVQFGMPAALLQAKELRDEQWNAAFWLMMAIGVVLAVVAFAGARWMGEFYGDRRYADLMRWMAVLFVVTPFSSINGTMLRREMRYKTLAKISISGAMGVVVVSVGCALAGMGAYTFVISGLFGAILAAVLMARCAPWRPSVPRSFRGMGRLWRYGWRMHVNNSLNLTASRVDNMMVGRLVGVYELGIYNRAFASSRMPVNQILSRLYTLFFSGFSRVQDDVAHSKRLNKKILCAMTSAIFPMLLILVFTAHGFLYVLYGEKWLSASTPMAIMAIGSFALVVSATLGALSDAQGLVGREIPIQAANVVMTVAAVWLGARWGLSGIAVGIAVKSYVILFLLQRMLGRSHLEMGWWAIMEAVQPALIATSVAAVAALALRLALYKQVSLIGPIYVCSMAATITVVYAAAWLLQVRLMEKNEPLQSSAALIGRVLSRPRRVAERG